jgi:hypothetical protein
MNTNISNGNSATPGNITASRLVPEADRMNTVDKLFGLQYVLKLEPLVFQFAEHLSAENYDYGYWAFYCLDSGGFYMAPLGNASGTDVIYNVSCPNGFDGQMTADALGITACLYAYSHLSFGEGDFAETCANHYHWLREYAMDHPEVSSILRAID